MSIGLPEKEKPLKELPSLDEAGILVVDDDPAFQLGLKTFLREYAGFEKVFVAGNAEEALTLIEAEPSIEVITLDNEMPGMTGIEMLTELKESAPRPLSVVMITGKSSAEMEKSFREFNSDKLLTNHYMAKPVSFEELEPVVLRSYQELKSHRPAVVPDIRELIEEEVEEEEPKSEKKAIDPTTPVSPPANMNEQLKELQTQLEQNTETINELRSRIPTIEQRFWMGILKLASLAVLVWMAIQLGGIDLAKKWGDELKRFAPPGAVAVDQKEAAADAVEKNAKEEIAKKDESNQPPAASPAATAPAIKADTKKEPKKAETKKPDANQPKTDSAPVPDKEKAGKPKAFQPITGPVVPEDEKSPFAQ